MKKNELYKLIMNKVKNTEFGNLSKYEQNNLLTCMKKNILNYKNNKRRVLFNLL